jgi:hypothetical protein
MTHHGFKYVSGLNIDTIPLDLVNDCTEGGLYFCDEAHITEWVSSGELVADVTLPDDAVVVMTPTKYKANKIILSNVRHVSELKQFEDPAFCIEHVHFNLDSKESKLSPEITQICKLEREYKTHPKTMKQIKIGTGLNDVTEEFCMKMISTPMFLIDNVDNLTVKLVYHILRQSGYLGRSAMMKLYRSIDGIVDIEKLIYEFPSFLEGVEQTSQLQWIALHRMASTIRLIKDPSKEMWQYVCKVNPEYITGVCQKYRTAEIVRDVMKHRMYVSYNDFIPSDEVLEHNKSHAKYAAMYKDFVTATKTKLCDILPFLESFISLYGCVIYGSFIRFCLEQYLEHKELTRESCLEFLKTHDIDINITGTTYAIIDVLTSIGILEYLPFSEYNPNMIQLDTSSVRFSKAGRFISRQSGNLRAYSYNLWIKFERQWIKLDISLNIIISHDYMANAASLIYDKNEPYWRIIEDVQRKLIHTDYTNTDLKRLYRIKKLLAAGYRLDDDSKATMKDLITPLMIYDQIPFVVYTTQNPDQYMPPTELNRIYEAKLDYQVITQKTCFADPSIKLLMDFVGI